MVAIFAFIDFQNVFSPTFNTAWNVPKFYQALNNAISILKSPFALPIGVENMTNLQPIVTGYVPPKCISGVWKEYFDMYPNIPQDPNNHIFDIDKSLIESNKFTEVKYPCFSKWKPIHAAFENSIQNGDENVLYLCGVSTDCCILATALEAVDAGIKVYVIKDACAAGNDESHENAIKIMQSYYPNIIVV